MCMFCGIADPSHDQALLGLATLVVGGAGGLLVPWHLIEEPLRRAGHAIPLFVNHGPAQQDLPFNAGSPQAGNVPASPNITNPGE
jgi:hypothetical protein